MNKVWQTVVYFAVISAMLFFIFSALRPTQYLAEDKFLIISDSVNFDCNTEWSSILEEIIKSEEFQSELNKLNGTNIQRFNFDKNIKIKSKDRNIVVIRIGGESLNDVQKIATSIKKVVLAQADKYYSVQNAIRIKVLIDAKIIRTPKVILENTIKGFIGGLIVGLIATFLWGLRLDVLKKVDNNKKSKKKKRRGIKNKFQKEKVYKNIIKKRLEKELSKNPIKGLNLSDEEYAFTTQQNLKKNINSGGEKNVLGETVVNKKNNSKELPNVKVIAASTMIISKQNKKHKEGKVPDNLPIFIEKELVDNNKLSLKKSNGKVIKTSMQNKEADITPGLKKASAHNIANGFAPDTEDDNGPSNEEIKDRLNRLLRGEL